MSQYEHARDNRSDEKYLSDFKNGISNQRLAIEQYVWDKWLSHDDDREWGYRENPDKEFQTDGGSWVYTPDYTLLVDGVEIPLEVKVQMAPLGDFIYAKRSQIDHLAPMSGRVLYAIPMEYSVIRASDWNRGELVSSSPLGGKPAYRLPVADITWTRWRYLPPFKNY